MRVLTNFNISILCLKEHIVKSLQKQCPYKLISNPSRDVCKAKSSIPIFWKAHIPEVECLRVCYDVACFNVTHREIVHPAPFPQRPVNAVVPSPPHHTLEVPLPAKVVREHERLQALLLTSAYSFL